MSTRERYIKVIESLVNGEEAEASDLLHEAFVEKAREIWNDLVEADEVVEDKVAEEDIDEAIGDEKADDFIDDIEEDDDEIEAEEMYGEDDEGEDAVDSELTEPEAEMELSVDGDADLDGDGEIDDHETNHEEIEDKLVNVEDALADLKAEFAKIMGDEEAPVEDPELEMEPEIGDELEMEPEMEPEMEETAFVEGTKSEEDSKEEVEETKAEEAEEESEKVEEAAELKAVGKVAMPDGSDGKSSPVGPGDDKGGDVVDMSNSSDSGDNKGLTGDAKDMNVTHPGDGAKLTANPAGHGAEKKGKAS